MKAVCLTHHVAYETASGCADCLASERERYLGRHDVAAENAYALEVSPAPWTEQTTEEMLADMVALMRTPPCQHDYNVMRNHCVRCGRTRWYDPFVDDVEQPVVYEWRQAEYLRVKIFYDEMVKQIAVDLQLPESLLRGQPLEDVEELGEQAVKP